MKISLFIRTLVVVVSAGFLSACNGSGSSGSNADELRVDPSTLGVGQGTIVTVGFSYSADEVFDEDQDVTVVVRLPAQLTYRAGSAEIQRLIDDHSVSPVNVAFCGDGSSFVEFNLNEFDLDDAYNPDGDVDAELTFTADAVGTGAEVVRATSRNNGVPYGCDSSFVGEASGAFLVQ